MKNSCDNSIWCKNSRNLRIFMAIIQVIAGVGTAVLGVLCFLEKIDLIFPILGIFFCICLASINSILAMMEYKKDGAEKVYDEKIHEKIL